MGNITEWLRRVGVPHPPYAHQAKYLEECTLDPYHALFWEMGTGKTLPIIHQAAYLFHKNEIEGLLVITLNGVHTNWMLREIPKHMPKGIPYMDFIWTSYKTKAFYQQVERILAKPRNRYLRIAAINVEALSSSKGQTFCYDFITSCNGRVLSCVDESDTIKDPASKRTVFVLGLGKLSPYRRILSGTPITQSPFDIYTQGEFLSPGLLHSKNHWMFCKRYGIFKMQQFGQRKPYEVLVEYQHLDELRERIKPWSSELTKSVCLDLPPKSYEIVEVSMSKVQEKAYKQMKAEWRFVDDIEEVTVDHHLTRLIRLHQICLGYMPVLNEEKVVERVIPIQNHRLEVLSSVIQKCRGKVIVWAHFRQAIEDVASHLRMEHGTESVVMYYGATSQEDREEAIDNFQNPMSKIRFFVGNSQAGFGITLTQAQTVIYYSNGYKLRERVQSEDRAHRAGLVHPVTYVDLICPDTVDERVMEALRGKVDIASKVSDLAKEWLK